MTTLYLVRHAQSLPRREQAESDWGLSDVGSVQARGLTDVLGALAVRHVYSSPYRRCCDTLAPFAAAAGVSIVQHEGLRERRIAGQWLSDFREVWQRSWADFSYALDGGETSWVCRSRMVKTVEEIAIRHADETIALGSHGNSIGLFMHFVDASFGIEDASRLRTPEILRVLYSRGAFLWDRNFSAGEAFERLATDFRLTPGIVA